MMIDAPIRTPNIAVASLWSKQLLAMLRPEFLVPVIFPSNSDPVLGSPDCSVAGCARPQTAWGLCSGHASQYRAAGVKDRSAWIATAQPTLKGHGKARACAVPDCRRGLAGAGLCSRHLRRWKADQPAVRETWLNVQVVVDGGRPDCRVAECPLQAESTIKRLCRPHDGRWRQRGFPPIEEFVEMCETYGLPRFNLGQLPEPMRWEIAYGLQCRVDDRRAQAPAQFIGPLLNWLAATNQPTLLERGEEDWRAAARVGLGGRGSADGFLHFTFEVLADLTGGTGWEAEYPRDIWRLRHLGVTEARTARLHFDRITQSWLRELAKQWTRWRLTTGGSPSVAAQGIGALVRLSTFLQETEPSMAGPADLTRQVLERFLASLTELPLIAKTRGGIAGIVGAFLRHVRQHGWAPDLAPTAVIYPDDIPRRPAMGSRALSEYLMAQLESPSNLARFAEPDLRLITEILMRTGLRAGDACQLPADCVTRDRAGAAYLRYVNHKMRRDAVIPIDEELAAAIHAQLERIRRRWPAATCLFPRRVSNPDGTRPLGYSTYRTGLTRWLAACDIRDESGQPAHVTPHQWRHTYGSRMVNADVPLHIVKQLLDHSSDTMTAHYARLNQATVRRHWEQAHRVNIAGEPVPVEHTSTLADAEWVKENLARAKMALPNGMCTLPLQKSCAHANAPLTELTPGFGLVGALKLQTCR